MRRTSIILNTLLLGVMAAPLCAQTDDPDFSSAKSAKAAATPLGTAFTYQGRLLQGGTPVDGTVNLSFTVYDAAVSGSVVAGPIALSSVPVTGGLFTVELDFGSGVFGPQERWMEVAVNGSPLSPLQLITAAPVAQYALSADGSMIMNIDASNLTSGTIADGRLSGPYTSPLFFDNASNTYNGTGLSIETSTLVANGGNVGIGTSSPASRLDVRGGDYLFDTGSGRFRLRDNAAGDGWVWDTLNSGQTLVLQSLIGGPLAIPESEMYFTDNFIGVGRSSPITSAEVFGLSKDTTSWAGMYIDTTGNSGLPFYGYRSGANPTVYHYVSGTQWRLWTGGDRLTVSNNGYVGINTTSPSAELHVAGSAAEAMVGVAGGSHVTIDGQGNNSAGEIQLYSSTGASRMELDAGYLGSFFRMSNSAGTPTVNIVAEEVSGQGATLKLTNSTGAVTIELDADYGSGTGNGGRIITDEVQITGGADLSEQFDVDAADLAPEPGMVVSIDPDAPGRLRVSDVAYDRMVAGVISGANGIRPGLLMSQHGTDADGRHPVALTGRVYVMCDASNGSIQPGDLLTTSSTPGHAMKVADHTAAQGAIIGKAMTSLDEGQGMVLVLVSLQ